MAGIKINNLPNSTTLSNNDYIITENGVATQKTSIEQIINKVDDESKFNDRIANNLITTEPDLLLDARQGKVLDEKIATINNKLDNQIIHQVESWEEVQSIVRAGLAPQVFSVGDMLVSEYNGAEVVWSVIGVNHDTPTAENMTNSLTIQTRD